jgi:NAD(P)-dependent dehydrogenase (short-subunit alcohol dehydrogenase family)
MRLQNKVAIVTGAARGVGEAIVRRMAQEAACVVAVDVLKDRLETVVASIRAQGFEATALAADIATREGNQEAVEHARSHYGGLDILHCNAAVIHMADLASTTDEMWDETLATNLKGIYLGCQAAIPELQKRGGGSLIFTASVLGLVGDPDLPAYGAAKGGLRALCRSLAVAHGPQNIRCNTICPGDIGTQMFAQYIEKNCDPQMLKKIIDFYPLRRIATPEDIANVALFLASDEGSYISGTDIVVDGGLLAKCY